MLLTGDDCVLALLPEMDVGTSNKLVISCHAELSELLLGACAVHYDSNKIGCQAHILPKFTSILLYFLVLQLIVLKPD